jgi:alanine racemase
MNATQLRQFRAALAVLPSAPASLAASDGIMLGKDYAFDLVRPGIALYGGAPQTGVANPFAAVAFLSGKILQIRRVDSGGTVGYGATFRPSRSSRIATVGIGYADGLPRSVGNRGRVAVQGRRVPIVGRVSMDLVTLDVTELGDACRVGAEVEFLGATATLADMADAAGTISYEILTSLAQRLPRHYVETA